MNSSYSGTSSFFDPPLLKEKSRDNSNNSNSSRNGDKDYVSDQIKTSQRDAKVNKTLMNLDDKQRTLSMENGLAQQQVNIVLTSEQSNSDKR